MPDLGARLPTLRGPEVELRWLTRADVPALLEIFSDPEVTRFLGVPRLRNRADAGRFLAEIQASFH
ncbi:MAG TPA: GNAT family N-acetyltransferase, partial [Thermoanaerobaculia bacterium]|nr:GNAT family N-acetyltransferase [Thermoanaerobaculia bacterium]